MRAALLVRGIAYRPDACRAGVDCHTDPTELVATHPTCVDVSPRRRATPRPLTEFRSRRRSFAYMSCDHIPCSAVSVRPVRVTALKCLTYPFFCIFLPHPGHSFATFRSAFSDAFSSSGCTLTLAW